MVLANSPTREDVLLAILLATDAYDTPLIAGIKPDGTGNYGEREVETNMVLSVYSRQNFIRYFALLRDMDAFVFVSGRKNRSARRPIRASACRKLLRSRY